MTVWLKTIHEVLAREQLLDWLKDNQAMTGDPAYLVDQSIERSDLVTLPQGTLGSFRLDMTIGGRIFGPNAELRWSMRGAEFDVWSIRETDQDDENSGPLNGHMVVYYCLGQWNPDKDRYVEGNLSVELEYPQKGTIKGDRLRVEVMEYLAEPEYFSANATDDDSTEEALREITNALNLPRVVAARFCGVDVGSTPDTQEGA